MGEYGRDSKNFMGFDLIVTNGIIVSTSVLYQSPPFAAIAMFARNGLLNLKQFASA